MDKIQQLILDTYAEKPRHYTQILKRNIEVLEYVKIHASHLSVFLEQLYFIVYRTTNICEITKLIDKHTRNYWSKYEEALCSM